MLLIVDIGNTNVHLGLAKMNEIIEGDLTLNSDVSKTAADYFVMINSLLQVKNIKSIIISSVVPSMTNIFRQLSLNYFKIKPMILTQPLKTGIKVIADNPKEVGADLIAAAAGLALEGSHLIVDLGTANKMIYVKNKTITGVVIGPGVETGLKGLIENTALLPSVAIKKPKKILGNQTIECIQSGVYYGTVAYIKGMIEIIKNDVKEDFKVILTGGNSLFLDPKDLADITFDKYLIFKGLINIYNLNKIKLGVL